MFQFLTEAQSGCRQSFLRYLLHRITTLSFFLLLTIAPQLIYPQVLQADQSTRPNVLLIMTDDQGYGDIRMHGNPHINTPVQDRLAAAGARFERFYVSPVCAPTRASLLTGRYHLRTGVHGVTRGYENMRSEEVTIAEVFKNAGYATGGFGKWHNGRHMPLHPNGQGFDTFIGFCGGHWNTYFNAPLEFNGKPIISEGYIADFFTNVAMRFMDLNQDKPWFCYVAYNTPHSPWRVPDRFWAKYNGLGLDTKAQCAYAMVENIDENLDRLLHKLDELKVADDTIVLFLTDNGANSPRFNAGMKGRKGSVDEGGTRVPLFVRYPNIIRPGTTIKPIAFHLDILPTLAEFCEIELEEEHQKSLDGQSLVPLLTEENAAESWPERMYFTENYQGEKPVENMRAAVRTDRWRAVKNRKDWELYDMLEDPGQQNNIATDHSDTVTELSQAFDNWFADVVPEPLEYPAIPVGHKSRTRFSIPANEALLHPAYGEGIKWTGDTPNGYANSWITEWTSVDAWPEWKLNVLGPGTYRISIKYCCHAEDVGSRLRVDIGEQSLLVNVPKAHDPPFLNKPDHLFSHNYQDRDSWATMFVGDVDLESGETSMTVKIEELAGDWAIELKSVEIERVE